MVKIKFKLGWVFTCTALVHLEMSWWLHFKVTRFNPYKISRVTSEKVLYSLKNRDKVYVEGGSLHKWDAHVYGTICVNYDVVVNKDNAGIGIMFREFNGHLITGICFKVGEYPVLIAEMLAITEGALKAVDLGFKCVKIQSESHLSVKFMNGVYRIPWFLRNLVSDILSCK